MTDKKSTKPRRVTLPIPDSVAHEINQAVEKTGMRKSLVIEIVSAKLWEPVKGNVAETVIAELTRTLRPIGGGK